MGKHTFKEWMIAVRAWSFPASAMPVIVSTAYVYWKFRNGAGAVGGFVLWPAIAALALMVLLHAAGNTWSDWFDFRKGVDAKDTFGATSLTSGMFTPREIMVISIVIITACILGGIALVIAAGLPLLWIGLGGLACLLVYPFMKYHAAGDLAIFLAFGILPAFGTEYATTGTLSPDMLWPAIPVSLITVAILHANNTRDTATDIRSRIRTVPIAFGPRTARAIYYIEILLPFLWTAVCALTGLLPWWSLISLIATIPATKAIRIMAGSRTAGLETVRALDAMTAQLQTVFSLLLAASFLLAAFL